jgi:branched-chain amino acid aminotransferase
MSFTASALKKVATKAPTKITSIVGASGPVYGSRLLEIDYKLKGGWQTPILRDYGDLTLSPQISAFHYGLVVFDHVIVCRDAINPSTLRFFRPDIFTQRLAHSRDYLHFAKYDDKELMGILSEMVRDDADSVPTAPGEKYLLRTNIIGNNNNLSAGPADEFKLYTFGILVNANPSGAKPLKLKADARYRRSWLGGTGDVSMSGNYANQIFHERQARAEGYDRHLWLVDDDAITTAGDSNFFAVFKRAGGQLDVVTPALDGTMMPGVVRDSIIQLLSKDADITMSQQKITAKDLAAAFKDGSLVEAFSTSSSTLTRSIGNVWYADDMINVPAPADGIAARMKQAIEDIQTGKVESDWTVKI